MQPAAETISLTGSADEAATVAGCDTGCWGAEGAFGDQMAVTVRLALPAGMPPGQLTSQPAPSHAKQSNHVDTPVRDTPWTGLIAGQGQAIRALKYTVQMAAHDLEREGNSLLVLDFALVAHLDVLLRVLQHNDLAGEQSQERNKREAGRKAFRLGHASVWKELEGSLAIKDTLSLLHTEVCHYEGHIMRVSEGRRTPFPL